MFCQCVVPHILCQVQLTSLSYVLISIMIFKGLCCVRVKRSYKVNKSEAKFKEEVFDEEEKKVVEKEMVEEEEEEEQDEVDDWISLESGKQWRV
ncbi:hypothetical protein LSTR_LSTR010284 [Laodelphax striatellus]|uniref:Uncharacterized protein n=1 Tax=Laodelphax striatellus TaxID=195883 RepID=A0A482XTW4_LAOST|nr:hypothetical protein LSTR_LSTR010284 [Laodelphax striatellus]